MAKQEKPVGGSSLDRFARLTRGRKIATFVVIGAVLAGLYWYLFYSDMSDELATAKRQAGKLATESTELKQRLDDFKKLRAEKKALEDGMQHVDIVLPKSAPLASFVGTLQSQMQVANVQLKGEKPEAEVPFDGNMRVPVRLEVTGDYYQLLEFFKLLYETPRIITVQDLSIGDAKHVGDQLVLTAKFMASTFRAADVPPPPAPGAPGAKPKGAAK
jgi:Tfp pilus assembly protein PilO